MGFKTSFIPYHQQYITLLWSYLFSPGGVCDSLLRQPDCDPKSLPAHLFTLSSEVYWAPGSHSQTFPDTKPRQLTNSIFLADTQKNAHQGSAGTKLRGEINRNSCCLCVGISKQHPPHPQLHQSKVVKRLFLFHIKQGVPLYRI